MSEADASKAAYEDVKRMINEGIDPDNPRGPFAYDEDLGFYEANGAFTSGALVSPTRQSELFRFAQARKQRQEIDQMFIANGTAPRDPLIDQVSY